jgi:hypothetical protein
MYTFTLIDITLRLGRVRNVVDKTCRHLTREEFMFAVRANVLRIEGGDAAGSAAMPPAEIPEVFLHYYEADDEKFLDVLKDCHIPDDLLMEGGDVDPHAVPVPEGEQSTSTAVEEAVEAVETEEFHEEEEEDDNGDALADAAES